MKDDLMRLQHMLDYAREVKLLFLGRSKSDLESDRISILALTRLIELIGEAASRISRETCEQYTYLP